MINDIVINIRIWTGEEFYIAETNIFALNLNERYSTLEVNLNDYVLDCIRDNTIYYFRKELYGDLK